MGACASVPKVLKPEEGTAPPPEPAKEEAGEVQEVKTNEEVKVEEEDKKEEGDVKEKVEDEKNDDSEKVDDENANKHQSLGSLLKEGGDSTENDKTAEKEVLPSEPVKEESKTEENPTSDEAAPVTGDPDTTAKVVPVEDAEKNKTEKEEEK